jgi:hypothetical protein
MLGDAPGIYPRRVLKDETGLTSRLVLVCWVWTQVSREQLQELTRAASAALSTFTADHVSIVLLSLAHLGHDPGEPAPNTETDKEEGGPPNCPLHTRSVDV